MFSVNAILFRLLHNWIKGVTGSGMTESQQQTIDYEDEVADKNADIAYRRQRELTEDFGPAWQIEQQAQGYKSVGLNLMSLAGTQPGVSASTAPVSEGGSAGSVGDLADPMGALSSLIGLALQGRKLGIESKVADAESLLKKQSALGLEIDNKYKEEKNKIELENMRLNAVLTKTNIRKITADSQNAEIQALYAPDLFQSQIDVANSNVALASSNIDKNVSEISVNEARVKEINALAEKHKHEFAQIDALTAKIREEYNFLIKQEELTDVQIREGEKRIEKYDSEIRLIGKQIGLAEKDIQYYIMNHVKVLDVSDVDKAGLSISYIDPETGSVVKDGAGLMPKTKVQIPY